MNVRAVVSVVLVLSFSFSVAGQQVVQQGGQVAGATAVKQERERRILSLEDSARKGEASHVPNIELAMIYEQLGLLYQDVAQWTRAESSLEHAVLLLRRDEASKKELVQSIGDLGNLHVVMGKFRESEKEQEEALRLAGELGDKLQIARSWNDVATLALARHKYERAKDFAQQASAEFAVNDKADPYDAIFSRYTLALAECHLGDYARAVTLLRAAVDEAKEKMQTRGLVIGFGEFLLGYALWKSGDMSAPDAHFEEGVARVKEQLGWGHPVYLKMLGHYSKYLRETLRMEAANDVDRQIRRAEGVVDVRTLEARKGASGFDALR